MARNQYIFFRNKEQALGVARQYCQHGFRSYVLDTHDTNPRAGHSRYKVVIVNPGIDDGVFETQVNDVWNSFIRRY